MATSPTTLSAVAGDQNVTLNWSGGNHFYSLYRGVSSGGPYVRVASLLTNTVFADNTVSNGITYHYVVTGLNILAEESPYSPEAVVTPTSGISTNIVVSVASGNGLQLFWPGDHTGWILQAQTNGVNTGLGTNWQNVINSTGTNQVTLQLDPTTGSVFYRLVHP